MQKALKATEAWAAIHSDHNSLSGYPAGSVIITTNLTFERWEEVFKDPVLTAALVDRLAHKAHVLNKTGESYRVRERKGWLK